MGIVGLLPVLKDITRHVDVATLSGRIVGVDGYTWLHKAVYGCAVELALGMTGSRADSYIRFCEERTRMLLARGVTPHFVFDGANLPAKAGKEDERRQARETALAEGRAAHARGATAEAHAAFSRGIDVTPAMAHRFIARLRAMNIAFTVAPYEADAQLAFLYRTGVISAVITEDSDLLPYGCRRVFFKMDKGGSGQLIELDDLPQCKELSFATFTADHFLTTCILAGCDYSPSLTGVGIKVAHSFVRRFKGLDRVLQMMRFERTAVPVGYEDVVKCARMTFLHQRVYDATTRRLVHTTPLPAELAALPPEALDFLGPDLPPALAIDIAEGRIDPSTRLPYNDEPPRGNPGAGGGVPLPLPRAGGKVVAPGWQGLTMSRGAGAGAGAGASGGVVLDPSSDTAAALALAHGIRSKKPQTSAFIISQRPKQPQQQQLVGMFTAKQAPANAAPGARAPFYVPRPAAEGGPVGEGEERAGAGAGAGAGARAGAKAIVRSPFFGLAPVRVSKLEAAAPRPTFGLRARPAGDAFNNAPVAAAEAAAPSTGIAASGEEGHAGMGG